MASFIETYGGNLGANASGLKAVQRALDAGLTINEIRNQAAREGVSFGYRAQDYLAARPASSFVAQFGGNEETMSNAGLKAIEKAQQAGLSLGDIQSRAQQEGINWGIGAQGLLSSYNTQQDISRQQQAFQQQIQQQQAAFQQQLAEQQRQAQEAQRQLMINMQRGDRAPAAVKTASSGAEQSGLTRRGTTGYFGRRGMRIGSLNVPSTGLAIAPNMQMSTSGSFA